MSHAMTLAELPSTLGAFKPVGHVMVALPNAEAVGAAMQALTDAGFPAEHLIDFSAATGATSMAAMIEGASEAAGFGYEITLMRRYLQLSRDGYRWLLVYAPEEKEAEHVKEVAVAHGAPMAVKYHRLVVEDLI